MLSRKVLLLAVIGFSFVYHVHGQEIKQYEFDHEHTRIGFSIRHIGIIPVKGLFTEYSGTLVYGSGPEDASVEVTINAASIDTGVERRDRHLRNEDFFDVITYPEITFKSKRIEEVEDQIQAIGMLTMHGITKEIVIPFSITNEILYPNSNIIYRGLEAQITLNRIDFGIGSEEAFLQVMKNGSAWASEEVDITLDIMWERRIPHVADLLATTIKEDGIEAAILQFDQLYEQYHDKEVYSFSVNAINRVAKSLLEEGEHQNAIELYKLSLKVQPDWWWLYTPLAQAYESSGDYEMALETFKKVLEYNPEDADATAAVNRLSETH